MSWWEAALLGIVQGLTEFLPISSSGHLVLGKYLLGLETSAADDLTFDVFVHFGTVLSIFTVYWRSIFEMTRDTLAALTQPFEWRAHYQGNEHVRTALNILITMVPTGLVYVIFKDDLEAAFANPRLAATMLLVTGVLLLLTRLRKNPQGLVTPGKSILIGIAQSSAMIPGISRSGATICTALYQNVTPEKAANFSFLMLLPVVLGATLIKSLEIAEHGLSVGWLPLLIGTVLSYGSGILAIKIVLDFVRRGNLAYFAYYCFLIGIIGFVFI